VKVRGAGNKEFVFRTRDLSESGLFLYTRVGHAYPFYSLAGGQYLDEGQAAVVRPGGAGIQILARVGLKEWRELAALPR